MMEKQNRMLAAAAVLSLVGGIFSQDAPYKWGIRQFLMITALVVFYNIFLYIRRVEWEHRRNVMRYSGMGFFTMGLMQGISMLRQMESADDCMRTGLGIALMVVLLGAFLLLLRAEKGITEIVIMTVIFAGFLVRIFYVVMTDAVLPAALIFCRQRFGA